MDAAQLYCRNLARTHYENFVVGSILVPRKYMQHLYNIYAFCRHSDDLADETPDPQEGLGMLGQWREQLKLCYGGSPTHPILVALQSTISEFDIPIQPFEDLISAFEQDCRVTRYDTYADLEDYCTRSANPVGRLFLWMFGYRDAARQELSDRICTGLQLANFWQDVVSDYGRGRVYLPREDMDRFGCSESDIAERRLNGNFINLMRFEVDRTQKLFESAAGLSSMLNRRLSVDVELFRRAGMAVLRSITRSGYNVLEGQLKVSKLEKTRLLMGCLLGRP